MNNDINNPFNWRMRKEPSIFVKDIYFRARSDGKTDSQRSSEVTEAKKINGKSPPVVPGLGESSRVRTEKLLAYKQFGVYSQAKPSKKPNKHEGGK